MDGVRARMLAYIAPRAPCCDEQCAAFDRAVLAQYEFERAGAGQQSAIPQGVTQFSVNGFSAHVGHIPDRDLFPAGVCPEAKAHLLLAGLLYRGVRIC